MINLWLFVLYVLLKWSHFFIILFNLIMTHIVQSRSRCHIEFNWTFRLLIQRICNATQETSRRLMRMLRIETIMMRFLIYLSFIGFDKVLVVFILMSKRIVSVQKILVLLMKSVFTGHEQLFIIVYLVDQLIFSAKLFYYIFFLSLHHYLIIAIVALCVFHVTITICVWPHLNCFWWAVFICYLIVAESLCLKIALCLHVKILTACLLKQFWWRTLLPLSGQSEISSYRII